MQEYINNFLNSKSEKRDVNNAATNYEYNYDGHCIKVYIPDSEITADTQAQLEKAVIKSITQNYKNRLCAV